MNRLLKKKRLGLSKIQLLCKIADMTTYSIQIDYT
jgi:hypothetical protein